MPNRVEIEDIEAMRRLQGIEDVELREAVQGLSAGDFVRITFLAGASGETLLVRITSIKAGHFRGKLASPPMAAALAHLRVGSSITFTTTHIHSLPRKQARHDR